MTRKKMTTKGIAVLSLLIAVMVVLTRFLAFEWTFLRISVMFIPFSIMGMLFGPLWTGLGGAVADVIGMFLFPKGPYFPGFTLNAFLEGALYGFFYYKKELTWKRVITATVVVTVIFHLFLTPLWLGLMYGVNLSNIAWWIPRLIKSTVFLPIQIITTYYIGNHLPHKNILEKNTL